jgi:peptidoglycan/LPS O-acetylase OafA/YrhL
MRRAAPRRKAFTMGRDGGGRAPNRGRAAGLGRREGGAPRLAALDLLRGIAIFAVVAVTGGFVIGSAAQAPLLALLQQIGTAAFVTLSGVGYGYATRWGRRWFDGVGAGALLLLAHAAYVGVFGPLLPGLAEGGARYALLPGWVALREAPVIAAARWWYPSPLWALAFTPVAIAVVGAGSGVGGRTRLALGGLLIVAIAPFVPAATGGWGLFSAEVGTPLLPFAGAALLGGWVGTRLHGGVTRSALTPPTVIALLLLAGGMAASASPSGAAIAAIGASLAVVAGALLLLDRGRRETATNRASDAPTRRPAGGVWRRLGRLSLPVFLLHGVVAEAAARWFRAFAPGLEIAPWSAAVFGLALALLTLLAANALPRTWTVGGVPRRWRPRAGPPAA